MNQNNENWWEHDREGLERKLALLSKPNRTPEETARMYSYDKSSLNARRVERFKNG